MKSTNVLKRVCFMTMSPYKGNTLQLLPLLLWKLACPYKILLFLGCKEWVFIIMHPYSKWDRKWTGQQLSCVFYSCPKMTLYHFQWQYQSSQLVLFAIRPWPEVKMKTFETFWIHTGFVLLLIRMCIVLIHIFSWANNTDIHTLTIAEWIS